jgi:hypothetical protein
VLTSIRALLIVGGALTLMSPAAAQEPAQPAAEKPAQPIRPGIESFDCTSDDEMKRGDSLRARHSGGPEGATWNWYGADLLCTVIVRGDCEGKGSVVLKVGRAPAGRAALALSPRDTTKAELRVPAKVWQRALKHRKDLVYETLSLAVRVDARCAAGAGGPSTRSWSDSFVGAFSGGE